MLMVFMELYQDVCPWDMDYWEVLKHTGWEFSVFFFQVPVHSSQKVAEE